MNRRHFTKVVVALAATFAAPTLSVAATQISPSSDERHTGKVTRLRIGSHTTSELRERNRIDRLAGTAPTSQEPPDDDNNYWAEVIENGGRFYYRAKGVTIAIEKYEFRRVVENPSLYYFSTALKLHFRIERARAGEMAIS